MFAYVSSHFQQFLRTLQLDATERADAEGKAERIARSLFARYYPNQEFRHDCYLKVGSYGKGLATPHSDLDMLFVLPADVYTRIEALTEKKQSTLLQEVKRPLLLTFPNTDISADGQVIVAPFQTYSVDIVPAFRYVSGPNAGSYLTAHTGDGGSWRISNPVAEYNWIKSVDAASGGKATDLIKMLKVWKHECNVEMKSVCLEVAASVFVNQWANRTNGIVYSYHDYLVRDFFAFLLNYIDGRARPAGLQEWIPLGNNWQTKCQSAYDHAVKACEYEHQDNEYAAATEWQKIFGSQFQVQTMPLYLSAIAGVRR